MAGIARSLVRTYLCHVVSAGAVRPGVAHVGGRGCGCQVGRVGRVLSQIVHGLLVVAVRVDHVAVRVRI